MADDLPLGAEVDWKPARHPPRTPLHGSYVSLRPVDADADADALFAVSHASTGDPDIWTYLPYGPYRDPAHMGELLHWAESAQDPLFFALVEPSEGRPAGLASYLRMTPEFGVIEIGHIWFGRPLQRTTAATEAIYLLARRAFDELGYRRLEWKCNALNAASRRAADRFGFRYEGVFRQHMVVKGRNRDSAWYAITDSEWPAIRRGYERWLEPDNFERNSQQKKSLRELIGQARRSS